MGHLFLLIIYTVAFVVVMQKSEMEIDSDIKDEFIQKGRWAFLSVVGAWTVFKLLWDRYFSLKNSKRVEDAIKTKNFAVLNKMGDS